MVLDTNVRRVLARVDGGVAHPAAGQTVAEVAAVLDRTVHATEALLVRARAAFRRSYESTGTEDVT